MSPQARWRAGCARPSIKNECLLVKLLQCLHSVDALPWARWVWAEIEERPLSAAVIINLGPHWKYLCALLQLYNAIPSVVLGDGRRTSFWCDNWLPAGPL